MKNKNKSPIASFQLSPVRKTIFGLWLNGERVEEEESKGEREKKEKKWERIETKELGRLASSWISTWIDRVRYFERKT